MGDWLGLAEILGGVLLKWGARTGGMGDWLGLAEILGGVLLEQDARTARMGDWLDAPRLSASSAPRRGRPHLPHGSVPVPPAARRTGGFVGSSG
jgi:hypothetical protein